MSVCTLERDSCLPDGSITRQTQSLKAYTFGHTKDIDTNVTIAGTIIPIRKRVRSFSLANSQGWKRKNYVVVLDNLNYQYDCYNEESLWELSVSEDSIFTDSTIFILDTEHADCFWKETEYKCKFAASSKEKTGFYAPTWEASKLRINEVNYDVTVTWKLMLSGVVETLYTHSYIKPMYTKDSPLFFVYPMPMSGISSDPDFGEAPSYPPGTEVHNYSFLDYRSGGFGPTQDEIKSGGQTYYYPEYLWYMGDYREEDQADAQQHFYDTYGTYANVKDDEVRQVTFPNIRGKDDPRGSICRNDAGDTLLSITYDDRDGKMVHVNRYYVNGVQTAIPDTIPGSNLRLYPVGLT